MIAGRPIRIVAVIGILTLAVTGCSSASPTARAVTELADRVGDAVWQVEATGCGWNSRGSAFAIDSRHLVTNHHVIANDTSPMIRSRTGERLQGKVIGAMVSPDAAVIEVENDLPVSLGWARTTALAKGEPLVVIGYPSPPDLFTATAGEIVKFQVRKGIRESALANAPIAKGNSGGPAVRSDLSVAGVVTMMTIPDNPKERVAIVFTSDTIRPTVEKFLREPGKPLSTCGLGPDYVPSVPKGYDIPEAPPTAGADLSLNVPPAVPRRTPAPVQPLFTPVPGAGPTTQTPCPRDRPVARISEITATEQPDQPGWWRVRVDGFVTNESSYQLRVGRIDVEIHGDPPVEGVADGGETFLDPGESIPWFFETYETYVYSPNGQPTQATVVPHWIWTTYEVHGCPGG
jgi:hypothetical protein